MVIARKSANNFTHMVARHFRIHGQVQGVGYRAAFHHEAEQLGLHGWVRNRHDGTVEALVQGSPSAIAHLHAWALRGTRLDAVTHIDVGEAEVDTATGFVIRFDTD
jgi:acylphosphatase